MNDTVSMTSQAASPTAPSPAPAPSPLERLILAEECRTLLAREARCLDERRWEEWLALYTPNCEYYVPAWHDDAPTRDPRAELSLIYYKSRKGLEERVWRITSGLSAASNVLPRTAHIVGSIEILEREVLGDEGEGIRVNAAFSCHCYRPERTHVFFGLHDYTLRRTSEGLRIARRRTVLMNDVVPNVLDVYSI